MNTLLATRSAECGVRSAECHSPASAEVVTYPVLREWFQAHPLVRCACGNWSATEVCEDCQEQIAQAAQANHD